MRSWLIVDHASDFDAALACGASCLAFDLGDGQDNGERERRRDAARDFFIRARKRRNRPSLYLRVAPLDDEAIDRDLAALVAARPDGVILPRARGGASIQHLGAKLAVHEAEAGIEDGATRIVAMATQTPQALFALGGYANSSQRLAALTFDAEDLRIALGAATFRAGSALTPPFASARALLLFGAAAAGVAAIDAAFLDIGDETGLRAECLTARRDGFSGKMAVQPAQIRLVNQAFANIDFAL